MIIVVCVPNTVSNAHEVLLAALEDWPSKKCITRDLMHSVGQEYGKPFPLRLLRMTLSRKIVLCPCRASNHTNGIPYPLLPRQMPFAQKYQFSSGMPVLATFLAKIRQKALRTLRPGSPGSSGSLDLNGLTDISFDPF